MKIGSILILIVVSLIVFGLYIYNFGIELSGDQTIWAALGDYIGGILNPLIAFFVFFYVIKNYESQLNYFKKQEFENHFFKLYDELECERRSLHESKILEKFNNQINSDKIVTIEDFKEWIYKRSDYPIKYFKLLEFIITYINENKKIENYSFLVKNKLSNLDLVYLALHDISQDNPKFTETLKNFNIYEFIDLDKEEVKSKNFLLMEYNLLNTK